MADNIAITAGAGTNVATDERTIAATTVHVQRVVQVGSANLKSDWVAPTSTATSATISSRDTRLGITLTNFGSVDCYVSEVATNAGSPSTTTDNSHKLPIGSSLWMPTTVALYIFTASGTGSVAYLEYYD